MLTKDYETATAPLSLLRLCIANHCSAYTAAAKTSTNINLMLKTKGSYVQPYQGTGFAGYGASGAIIATANQGGTFVVITDASGVIELKANASASGINYAIQAFQKLA